MTEGTSGEMDMMEYANRTERELATGAGLEFPMGGMLNGMAELGYEFGLTSVKKDGAAVPPGWSDYTIKMRDLFLSMGVRF
jgi:hypothetical protein